MQPDIRTLGLFAVLDSELVLVHGKVAEPVQGSRRSVGNNTLGCLTFPRLHLGGELEPSGAQLKVGEYNDEIGE